MKYTVKVEEILRRLVEVEANSPEEAENVVHKMYRDQEIVLDDSDLCGQVEITAIC